MKKIPSCFKGVFITFVIATILVILCPIVTDAIILDGDELFNSYEEMIYSYTIGHIGQIVIGVGGLVSCLIVYGTHKIEKAIEDLKNNEDKDKEVKL